MQILLIDKGVSVRTQRGFSKRQAILECWSVDYCPLVGDHSIEFRSHSRTDGALNAADCEFEPVETVMEPNIPEDNAHASHGDAA